MRVSRVLEGDIVRGLVQLKNRPCIVLKVEKNYVVACPLTSASAKTSKVKCATTPALMNNRFLKEKSHYTFSTIQISIEEAKENMLGLIDSRTLRAIKRTLQIKYADYLKV